MGIPKKQMQFYLNGTLVFSSFFTGRSFSAREVAFFGAPFALERVRWEDVHFIKGRCEKKQALIQGARDRWDFGS